jgi:hypothetical protein
LDSQKSNLGSEANFSGQLKASFGAEVTSVSCDSFLALFPAICCVEKDETEFANDKYQSGPVTILVDALSGVDQVLRA